MKNTKPKKSSVSNSAKKLLKTATKKYTIKSNEKIKRITLKPAILIGGLVFIVALMVSLLFSQFFETALYLFPNLTAIKEQSLSVHFVNVGQGDAILVKLPNNETMLIDAGPKNAENDLLFYIDNVFFEKNQPKEFNYVVLTHSDADHAGGMLAILNKYPVKNFYRPKIYSQQHENLNRQPYEKLVNTATYNNLIEKLLLLESQNKTNVIFTEKGLNITINETKVVEFLSPVVESYTDINDYSPIMVLSYYDEKIMLAGDATTLVETQVINNTLTSLDVDVLKLGHHGSQTSTSVDFLQATTPEWFIVSAGLNNSYNHPHEVVINNILNFNPNAESNILNTAHVGNIVFFVNENSEIEHLTIKDANSYLYIEWQIVVFSLSGVVVLFVLVKGVSIKKVKASNV